MTDRLTDDELTALLAEHPKRECFCGCGDTGCPLCGDGWPCQTVRLATEVKDLRAVWKKATYSWADEKFCRICRCLPTRGDEPLKHETWCPVARYEEGGR